MRGPLDRARDGRSDRARSGCRRAALATAAVVAVTALGACSGGGEDEPERTPAEGASQAAEPLTTDAALGKVRGRLSTKASDAIVAEITKVVDGWIDAGLGGEYPRTDFAAAFAGFTPDARALAVKQSALLTNAEVGADLERAELTERVVRVDVVAPKGRPVGATARIHLTVELDGGVERTDLVTGRLMLTPSGGEWRVFGFDVRRGEKGA